MSTRRATWHREWPPGWHVRHVESTGSTNADVLDAALAGAPDRSVIAADFQTAGRGRLDRRWDAPAASNLLVSMLFRHPPAESHQLTQRVGLAAVCAAQRMAGVDAGLKWPNDVVVGDAKLAGILAQAGGSGDGACVVVGLGLNVGWAPPGAARLGDDCDVPDVLAAVLGAFDELPADIGPLYRNTLATLGRRVRVELPGERGVIEGTAIDVEADGRLVVIDECAISHRADAGDVIHLRNIDHLR